MKLKPIHWNVHVSYLPLANSEGDRRYRECLRIRVLAYTLEEAAAAAKQDPRLPNGDIELRVTDVHAQGVIDMTAIGEVKPMPEREIQL